MKKEKQPVGPVLTPVETMKKQVSGAISMFKTIRDSLSKSREDLTKQISLRDQKIADLSQERNSLKDLCDTSTKVIEDIDKITA